MRTLSTLAAIAVLAFTLDGAQAQDRTPEGPTSLATVLRAPGVSARAWSAIVVHHSASRSGSVASIDDFHRRVRGFPRGLAYHFVIGNGRGLGDGVIEAGPRWTRQQPGAHVASSLRDADTHALWDDVAIGIVLIGNFEETAPTERQVASLTQLVGALRRRFHIAPSRVLGHGGVAGAHTECPGNSLDAIVHRLAAEPTAPPPARIRRRRQRR
ncbi:MAG: N-acetylmuramoyl-L-alanine amidase [Deltaproteobacteria bacterium]|nr:N-acetylmuramoyl-L-alanine amidase [Deltaproteobacteria bacterium]